MGAISGEARIDLPGGGILYDPGVAADWSLERFRPAWWAERGRVAGHAPGGRGSVLFVRAANGPGAEEWALRHYRRGGLVARLLHDRFPWAGPGNTRSFREWRLLRGLHARGLPVPRPVAAAYTRAGPVAYTADLLTLRIPGAEPLSARLAREPLPPETWHALGACIRVFHDAGVWHADLNAHNLLLDRDERPWLLDFDRGRIRGPGPWRARNLQRLLRSLDKIRAADPGLHLAPADWRALIRGYRQSPA